MPGARRTPHTFILNRRFDVVRTQLSSQVLTRGSNRVNSKRIRPNTTGVYTNPNCHRCKCAGPTMRGVWRDLPNAAENTRATAIIN
ncbi:hypothetical protein J6590_077919 [Homalodisca vitripennis]|nr:hypothetical protein J6590_077919 [Homalodisca vitripennis]